MKQLEFEDQIQDGQEEPWFCKLHNRPAEMEHINGWGSTGNCWKCPECDKYIEAAWAEYQDTGANSEHFPLLEG